MRIPRICVFEALSNGAEILLPAQAGEHLARYKLPKEIIRLDRLVRSPSGKADYRWARAVAADPPRAEGSAP